MLRMILSAAFCFLISSQVFAEELTPNNIVGRYKVTARAGIIKVYLNFNVLNATDFEIQRVYAGGRTDEVCTGTYTMDQPLLFWNLEALYETNVFKGAFSCPSNPSRQIDFNVYFKSLSVEDLNRGATVTVTTSLAPGRNIPAHIKRVD